MAKTQPAAAPELAPGFVPVREPQLSPARLRVICAGMKGILAYRDGRWILDNESELAVLGALGGSSNGVSRLRGITAALNSGAAGAKDVTNLNQNLVSIARTQPVWAAGVYEELMAATAVAAAHWDHPKAVQWLCWALSGRIGHNLSKAGTNGPGLISFTPRKRRPRFCGHNRDTAWLRRVGTGFWDRIASHEEAVVREVAEASNPETAASRLEELGNSPHSEVLDLVASHPNTPESTLTNLISEGPRGHRYPDDLLQFRVAQNLALTPEFIDKMTSYALDDSVRHLLIHHPNKSNGLFELMADFSSVEVDCWLVSHPDIPADTIKHIVEEHAAEDDDGDFDHELASNEWPAWEIRRSAAANPSLAGELLASLAEDRRSEVRAAAATNPNLTEEELSNLAGDRRQKVRAAAATNSALPETLLAKLASDRCAAVRAAVADNPNLNDELSFSLASDSHPRVRWNMAAQESAPISVLASLALDPHDSVRWLLARNPSVPQEAQIRLAADSKGDVRWELADNPSIAEETLAHLAGDVESGVRESVARHPSAPAAVLEMLSSDPESWVRESVAANPSASTVALAALASDPQLLVRSSVAGNPSTPEAVLEQLGNENDVLLLKELADNPSTPDSTLEHLARMDWASVFHPAREALAERR